MSDPIEQLQSLTQQGVDVTPLPPSEVRRRGDRLRRRNQALAAAGGVAAIALIATPIALLAGGPQKALPPVDTPTPTVTDTATPTPAPAHDIPAGFPLATGWPDPSTAENPEEALKGPSRTLEPFEFTACGNTLPAPDSRDLLIASWSNPEDGRTRELRTFETADDAVAYVDELAAFYRACPIEDDGNDMDHRYRVANTEVGGQSVGIVTDYYYLGEQSIGFTGYHVIRLGRAVLVISWSNEGWGKDKTVAQLVQGMTDEAAEPIAAMCTFTEAGC